MKQITNQEYWFAIAKSSTRMAEKLEEEEKHICKAICKELCISRKRN